MFGMFAQKSNSEAKGLRVQLTDTLAFFASGNEPPAVRNLSV